jgi:GTP-binding protein
MSNIVAIVGRPNVGKSTFFNRLVGGREAIMDDVSGVTRDRNYGYAEWLGRNFTVIDTGGYVTGSEDVFEKQIRRQSEAALEEATVILFMVDGNAGLHPYDEEFSRIVRRHKKPIIVVVNKIDNAMRVNEVAEFYSLGLDANIYGISSASGSGTGELLDELITYFPSVDAENPDEGIPRIAILGRPNAGKSSLTNMLLGEERAIVTEIAGTTRDSINARYKAFGKEFILIDTAGIRKRSKVKEDIEFYSVLRSVKALEDSDICVILLDAQHGLESQDMAIIWMALQRKKGIVLLVNKWDLIEKDNQTFGKYEKELKERLGPLSYIPIVFISVVEKQRVFQAIEKAIEVYDSYKTKIPTSQLNEKLLPEIEAYPPPTWKGKYIQIKYVTQLPTRSVTFAFFCNSPQYIREPYERYLTNKIRLHFGFDGVPINVVFRKK